MIPWTKSKIDSGGRPSSAITDIAFPDDEHAETFRFKRSDLVGIAGLVAGELVRPVAGVRFRRRSEPAACMRVPETAVNEDRPFAGLVRQIRLAGKIIDMIAEAQTQRLHGRSCQHLRFGILRADSCHHLRPRERLALPARWNPRNW